MRLIDPNTSYEEISDEVLISEFVNPSRFKKLTLYSLMAKRSNNNPHIKSLLFEVILSVEARRKKAMGFILHSWLPVISILKEGNDKMKMELRDTLKQWTKDEKEQFLDYIKSDQEYYCLLYEII